MIMKQNNKRVNPVIVVAILLLVLVLLYSGLRILESTVLHNGAGTEQPTSGKTIIRDGVEYFPRQDITVILLAGIDEEGPVKDSGSYNNTGEADMVSLLIFDEGQQKLNILSLNRDTMLDMSILGVGGKPAGTRYGQLALAHTYGSGLSDSAENLRNTVSNFLYGIQIDYYVTLNMDAIEILNDAVGGVTVTVTDDFSEIDPSISMGQVTLKGEQALNFIRTRQGLGNQLNLNRMERHKTYMNGFMDALQQKMNEQTEFVYTAYSDVSDYMVTDCSVKILGALLERYKQYGLGDVISVEGENIKGDQYMEYHVDADALDRVILDYLYEPKD
jgi:LCP family protein required for cell wall assembly